MGAGISLHDLSLLPVSGSHRVLFLCSPVVSRVLCRQSHVPHVLLSVFFTPGFPRDSSSLSVICPCLLASLVCGVDGSPLCKHVFTRRHRAGSLMNKAAVDAYIVFSLNVSVHFSVVNAQKRSSRACWCMLGHGSQEPLPCLPGPLHVCR